MTVVFSGGFMTKKMFLCLSLKCQKIMKMFLAFNGERMRFFCARIDHFFLPFTFIYPLEIIDLENQIVFGKWQPKKPVEFKTFHKYLPKMSDYFEFRRTIWRFLFQNPIKFQCKQTTANKTKGKKMRIKIFLPKKMCRHRFTVISYLYHNLSFWFDINRLLIDWMLTSGLSTSQLFFLIVSSAAPVSSDYTENIDW